MGTYTVTVARRTTGLVGNGDRGDVTRDVWACFRTLLRRVQERIVAGAALVVAATMTVAACAPQVQPPGPGPLSSPALTPDSVVTRDGVQLPLRAWLPDGSVEAVVLGLHGFNDYSNAFAIPAPHFTREGIAVYAYDQRGFGGTPHRGRWPGVDRLVSDAAEVVQLLAERHPGVPIHVLGLSMGGAISMVLLAERPDVPVAGGVLVAPAVWGRAYMPFYQRSMLWTMARVAPGLELTGRGLDIRPSDNVAMLRQLSADPMVIKSTRVDAMWGLVNLMDRAQAAAPLLDRKVLFLYGLKDDIVPKAPTLATLRRMPTGQNPARRVAVYDDGYHMLLRDLQGERVVRDVVSWIRDPAAPLPSGADSGALERLDTATSSMASTPSP